MPTKGAQSITGIAHEYANPELIPLEEGAFERAMSVKHSLSDLDNIQEEEPDEWDLKMIEEARLENDGNTISMEEMLKRCNLSKADIEDDEFCRQLLENYLNDPDEDKDTEYTLEECKKEWGLDVPEEYRRQTK